MKLVRKRKRYGALYLRQKSRSVSSGGKNPGKNREKEHDKKGSQTIIKGLLWEKKLEEKVVGDGAIEY